jgi:hypothetical protein
MNSGHKGETRSCERGAQAWLPVYSSPKPASAVAPDPMQRFIRFHNELSIPIYPVISADQTMGDDGTTSNCPAKYGNKTVLRILVNGKDGVKASSSMKPSW